LNIFSKFLAVLLLVLLAGGGLSGQESPVPLDLQYSLILKVLSFDRNFKGRVGSEIVIGIAYQRSFRTSLNIKDELLRAAQQVRAEDTEGASVRLVPIDVAAEGDLAAILAKENVKFLYITPLRAFDVRKLASVCREKRILSLTGVPDYTELGISVGFGVKGERPEIIINLLGAQAEGADFSSRLLSLARVIEKQD
jgi:hypothetical protein